jgi:hypothetical protein
MAHARFIDLAAMSVGWALEPDERHELDAHLAGCGPCRSALAAFERDERQLRQLATPRPLPAHVRASVARAAVRDSSARMTLLAAALLLIGLLAWALLQAGRPTETPRALAISGTWTAVNCATRPVGPAIPGRVDCTRWGDGRTLRMEIGPGTTPTVVVTDDAAGRCTSANAPAIFSTAEPAVAGASDGTRLWLYLGRACGLMPANADGSVELFHNPGDDEIWVDPDGDSYGLMFVRTE